MKNILIKIKTAIYIIAMWAMTLLPSCTGEGLPEPKVEKEVESEKEDWIKDTYKDPRAVFNSKITYSLAKTPGYYLDIREKEIPSFKVTFLLEKVWKPRYFVKRDFISCEGVRVTSNKSGNPDTRTMIGRYLGNDALYFIPVSPDWHFEVHTKEFNYITYIIWDAEDNEIYRKKYYIYNQYLPF